MLQKNALMVSDVILYAAIREVLCGCTTGINDLGDFPVTMIDEEMYVHVTGLALSTFTDRKSPS